MNLFVIGWCPSGSIQSAGAETALAALVSELPFFDGHDFRTWRAPSGRVAVACAVHAPARTGGVRYAHFETERMTLFSGRPFAWRSEFTADGRGPLDARFYLGDPEVWSESLDGRAVAARYDDVSARLDLYTDASGAYHVFFGRRAETQWFSNSPELIRRIIGRSARDPFVAASLVACGWSLGGQPIWRDVRRLPRAALHQFHPGGEVHREHLPIASIDSFFDSGFRDEVAARTLVATVRALADWPGRPSYVPLTGGRDSRLVFAAALHAGTVFEPRILVGSASSHESPDVQTARIVSESMGRSLAVESSRSVSRVIDAARILRLTAPGTLSLDLAYAALNRPPGSGLCDEHTRDTPLELVHSGHAGELARAYYGPGGSDHRAVARSLYRQVTHAWPRPPLSREGNHLVQEYIHRWVRREIDAGVSVSNLPDLFYLFERMENWVGPSHGFDEYMADLTSPLWTPRLLPHEFGLTANERARELFHFHVLNALCPELARVPFVASNPPWPTFGRTQEVRGRRARRFAAQAHQELNRRYQRLLGRAADGSRPEALAEAAKLAREHAPDRSDEVWHVLDRRRGLSLLARDPAGLDARSRRTAWRLATVFLACMSDP